MGVTSVSKNRATESGDDSERVRYERKVTVEDDDKKKKAKKPKSSSEETLAAAGDSDGGNELPDPSYGRNAYT